MITAIPTWLQEQNERQLAWCDNDAARDAHRKIWALDDELLLKAARGKKSAVSTVTDLLGSANPEWIKSTCASSAYDRGLIDEQELDWITR